MATTIQTNAPINERGYTPAAGGEYSSLNGLEPSNIPNTPARVADPRRQTKREAASAHPIPNPAQRAKTHHPSSPIGSLSVTPPYSTNSLDATPSLNEQSGIHQTLTTEVASTLATHSTSRRHHLPNKPLFFMREKTTPPPEECHESRIPGLVLRHFGDRQQTPRIHHHP